MTIHHFACSQCNKTYHLSTGTVSKKEEQLYAALLLNLKKCPNCTRELKHSENKVLKEEK